MGVEVEAEESGVGGYSTTEVGVEVEAGEVEQNKKMISVLTPDCD